VPQRNRWVTWKSNLGFRVSAHDGSGHFVAGRQKELRPNGFVAYRRNRQTRTVANVGVEQVAKLRVEAEEPLLYRQRRRRRGRDQVLEWGAEERLSLDRGLSLSPSPR
jgi:hypothetical protein